MSKLLTVSIDFVISFIGLYLNRKCCFGNKKNDLSFASLRPVLAFVLHSRSFWAELAHMVLFLPEMRQFLSLLFMHFKHE